MAFFPLSNFDKETFQKKAFYEKLSLYSFFRKIDTFSIFQKIYRICAKNRENWWERAFLRNFTSLN